MIATQVLPTDSTIVMPALTMFTNLQYQVIHLAIPTACQESVVAVTDGDDLVVTAEGTACRYYRRIPLTYHVPRQRIEIRPVDGTLEIRVPNPDLPRD